LDRRLCGPQTLSRRYGEKKDLLPLSVEPKREKVTEGWIRLHVKNSANIYLENLNKGNCVLKEEILKMWNELIWLMLRTSSGLLVTL
jgi:hypothetical protein